MSCQPVLQRVHTIFCIVPIIDCVWNPQFAALWLRDRSSWAACCLPGFWKVSSINWREWRRRLIARISIGNYWFRNRLDALLLCFQLSQVSQSSRLSTWLSYGMSWKTFSMFFSSITFLLGEGSHMRDPPLPSSSFLLRSELLPQSRGELFTVK